MSKGWNAPRKSLELVHPTGLGVESSNEDLHISFEPTPSFGGIAAAAAAERVHGKSEGWLYTGRAETLIGLEDVLAQAVTAVKAGRSALVEAVLKDDDS